MNIIRRQIKEYIRVIDDNQDEVFRARITFPASFTGFAGHFPDNPVLPGVCMVQAVLVMAGLGGRNPILKRIIQAKYFQPVFPGEEITLDYRETKNNGTSELRAGITRGDKKIARIRLEVEYRE